MRLREITYTETYKEFEVGEKVKLIRPYSNMTVGDVFTVKDCIPPKYKGDTCTVFLLERLSGIWSDYFEEASVEAVP